MPYFLHEFIDDEQDFYQSFLIDITITYRGAPASYFEPAEPAEYEIEDIIPIYPIPEKTLALIKKLPYRYRPAMYSMGGCTYYEGTPLSRHQQEFTALRMKKDWFDIIDENWDPSWVDYDDDYY